jgi:high-affinity Fe2+/Pb2+ permease
MSRERRKQEMRDRVRDTFGPAGEPLPPADRTGQVLEAIVAFALGTGFWRLLISDSWVVSAVFGVLLAALLFSYGLFRSRMAEKAAERSDDPPRRRRDG